MTAMSLLYLSLYDYFLPLLVKGIGTRDVTLFLLVLTSWCHKLLFKLAALVTLKFAKARVAIEAPHHTCTSKEKKKKKEKTCARIIYSKGGGKRKELVRSQPGGSPWVQLACIMCLYLIIHGCIYVFVCICESLNNYRDMFWCLLGGEKPLCVNEPYIV